MGIEVLDPAVASQIAAGEVVQRPASAVKELVENSLDAGATRVSVEARGGGVELIRVTDNGSGIPADQLEMAFGRHATSKVSGIDDLESIRSLGFRGEALPSIAAVAEVHVVSCACGDEGVSLRLSGGAVSGRGREARATGTTVAVRKLFQAVPARLKFLKSTGTENGHIARVVSEYALAYPEVGFSLTIEGRDALRTPGSGVRMDSAVAVYGHQMASQLLPLSEPDAAWQPPGAAAVTGLISGLRVSRANRDHLSFFVNRRLVTSRLLIWALEEAYHGLLMQGRHPVAIVNITLPPSEVDVNIHPTKAEVKFRNERAVFSAVQRAVRGTLVDLAPAGLVEEPAPAYAPPRLPAPSAPGEPAPRTHPTAGRSPGMPPAPMVRLPALRVLGQMASSYIVAEGPDGLYLVDQHAAHERVLYERYHAQHARQGIQVQGLLEPAPFEVTPQQAQVLRSAGDRLAEHGFSFEPFGERTYLVRAIPALLDSKAWPAMVRELLDRAASDGAASDGAASNGAVSPGAADWTEAVAITLACHTAVRAGEALSDEEMRRLTRDLEGTGMPRTCPHGRPTVLHLSSRQLGRDFGRS